MGWRRRVHILFSVEMSRLHIWLPLPFRRIWWRFNLWGFSSSWFGTWDLQLGVPWFSSCLGGFFLGRHACRQVHLFLVRAETKAIMGVEHHHDHHPSKPGEVRCQVARRLGSVEPTTQRLRRAKAPTFTPVAFSCTAHGSSNRLRVPYQPLVLRTARNSDGAAASAERPATNELKAVARAMPGAWRATDHAEPRGRASTVFASLSSRS